MGRQRAHDVVYDCCRETLTGKAGFLDALAAHPEIAAHMSRDDLAPLVDPVNYLGAAPRMVDRLLERRSAG